MAPGHRKRFQVPERTGGDLGLGPLHIGGKFRRRRDASAQIFRFGSLDFPQEKPLDFPE
ncbi:MAG: hypothetical protein JWP91_2526 [Fibrobacteres bacterium]|nr:hypothetical protein [Fibrobacterota bacterium]